MVHLFVESGKGHSIYLKDNYDEPYRTDAGQDESLVVAEDQRQFIVATPFDAPAIRTSPPQHAYEEVLANAGATKPERDMVDKRIIELVKNRRGKLLRNDPAEVGGWPELAGGTPYPDADMDGVSDDWEQKNGMDPANADDGQQDLDQDGWTNLEEFLHFMAGERRQMPTIEGRQGSGGNALVLRQAAVWTVQVDEAGTRLPFRRRRRAMRCDRRDVDRGGAALRPESACLGR